MIYTVTLLDAHMYIQFWSMQTETQIFVGTCLCVPKLGNMHIYKFYSHKIANACIKRRIECSLSVQDRNINIKMTEIG